MALPFRWVMIPSATFDLAFGVWSTLSLGVGHGPRATSNLAYKMQHNLALLHVRHGPRATSSLAFRVRHVLALGWVMAPKVGPIRVFKCKQNIILPHQNVLLQNPCFRHKSYIKVLNKSKYQEHRADKKRIAAPKSTSQVTQLV